MSTKHYTNLYNGDARIYRTMSTLNSLPHFTMSTKLSTQISTMAMIESIEQSTLLSITGEEYTLHV